MKLSKAAQIRAQLQHDAERRVQEQARKECEKPQGEPERAEVPPLHYPVRFLSREELKELYPEEKRDKRKEGA